MLACGDISRCAGADVKSLQRPDGSFASDAWGEVDTRFSYCALLAASILGRRHELDVPAAVRFVAACKNFDGGFGCTPGEGDPWVVLLLDGTPRESS